jgi:starch synthase (maltosyl-transferring)
VTSGTLLVAVDPVRAGFSAWYEMFPRSAGNGKTHGTFRDVEAMLPYVAGMGFDVLYLPPIHPIGVTKRKGRNNALAAAPGDPGSPWAIGGADGGHKAIHPELGTPEEFRHLVEAARAQGIEVALDIAFQCSPDHPYVAQHPSWFRHRPDGSIQYAENPPKKYQDIYPFNFDSDDWKPLWQELKSIFDHWIQQGVHVFRVDNPHTKPYPMWEWMIGELKRAHPQTIYLAEAFTRPRPMHRLAKLGYTQSYTYFTWRNTKRELTEYFTELSQHPSREYFRPNVWPNTPDILHEYLQSGLRPAFIARVVLAATLCANYGLYGPAFELMEHVPREPGSEEYRDSEKYEIKAWNRDRPDSLRPLLARLNAIRRTNPALHANRRLHFHGFDNPQIICYSKTTEDMSNVILTLVNLDPRHRQSGWTDLALAELGVDASSRTRCTISSPTRATAGRALAITWSCGRARCRPHVLRLSATAGPRAKQRIAAAAERASMTRFHQPSAWPSGAEQDHARAGDRSGTRTRSSTSSTSSVPRQQRGRHRRFSRPHRIARLHPRSGRGHGLAAAVLSFAAARRRLRHRRLPRGASALRHARGLPPLPARKRIAATCA